MRLPCRAVAPSMVQLALKILCRQCSELACANIISSASVRIAAELGVALAQVIDLVRRQRQAEPRIRRFECVQRHRARARRAPGAANSAAPSSRSASSDCVIGSCSSFASAACAARVAGQPARSMRDAALDAPHRQAGAVQDFGRLARPRRDRAQARHARSAETAAGGVASPARRRPAGCGTQRGAGSTAASRRRPARPSSVNQAPAMRSVGVRRPAGGLRAARGGTATGPAGPRGRSCPAEPWERARLL